MNELMMKNVSNALLKRKGYTDPVTEESFLRFLQITYEDTKVDAILAFYSDTPIKEIVSTCHMAESRVRNYAANAIDRYYLLLKERLG